MSIVFVMNAYTEDMPQLNQAIEHFRIVYATAPLTIVWDGPERESWFKKKQAIDRKYQNISHQYGDRIKTSVNAGAWSQRYLKVGLQLANDFLDPKWIFQFEPETLFLRDVSDRFPSKGIFTNVIKLQNGNKSVQGGAIGFDLESARKIVKSEYLLENEYQATKYSYRGLKSYFYRTRIACQDLILYQVIKRLKIKLTNFDLFSCYPHDLKDKVDPKKAVLHPVINKNSNALYTYIG